MNPKVNEINQKLAERIGKTLENLKSEYAILRIGKANAKVLDKVTVDAYGDGTAAPIQSVGNISSSDARTLVISPWDKSVLGKIEKAIIAANLGLTPVNDGAVIRLSFPVVTEERRKELVREVKKLSEEAKVAVRNIRHDALSALKRMKADKELSEDEYSASEKESEKIVQKNIEAVETLEREKEKEVLTV